MKFKEEFLSGDFNNSRKSFLLYWDLINKFSESIKYLYMSFDMNILKEIFLDINVRIKLYKDFHDLYQEFLTRSLLDKPDIRRLETIMKDVGESNVSLYEKLDILIHKEKIRNHEQIITKYNSKSGNWYLASKSNGVVNLQLSTTERQNGYIILKNDQNESFRVDEPKFNQRVCAYKLSAV